MTSPAATTPVIVAAKRTPIGRFLGGFSRTGATALGTHAVRAALDAAPAAEAHVDECIMGCVLQAGLGQNPARQAGLTERANYESTGLKSLMHWRRLVYP
ncbi:MAG: hypothetical protein AAF235_10060, partial [Planctomycetota bacterium]